MQPIFNGYRDRLDPDASVEIHVPCKFGQHHQRLPIVAALVQNQCEIRIAVRLVFSARPRAKQYCSIEPYIGGNPREKIAHCALGIRIQKFHTPFWAQRRMQGNCRNVPGRAGIEGQPAIQSPYVYQTLSIGYDIYLNSILTSLCRQLLTLRRARARPRCPEEPPATSDSFLSLRPHNTHRHGTANRPGSIRQCGRADTG
jgi:hypothetical protein